jgi:cytochrome P450
VRDDANRPAALLRRHALDVSGSRLRRHDFIAMGRPKHDAQRTMINPTFAPANCRTRYHTRTCRGILDELPRNETFDWVGRVFVAFTIQMPTTLFDYPFET